MAMTPRELTHAALRFEYPQRLPRDLWTLPWSEVHQADALALIREKYPEDLCRAPEPYGLERYCQGDPYAVGRFRDEWGCEFENIQAGAVGEVKHPPLAEDQACRDFRPPYHVLDNMPSDARDVVNRFCDETDRFVMSPGFVRPWERYQFLRGSEQAMMDLADPSDLTMGVLRSVHDYFVRELTFWAETDVDAMMFLDDWGSQDRLLISPKLWREVFKPMYAEYAQIAHQSGKYLFMHSDGHILAILPDLIEVGVDAINSQLFCMDLAEVAKVAKGRITFWGEIDRQHVLPSPDPQAGRDAVRHVAKHVYDPSGGIIAQIAFELSVHPPTAIAVYDEWERLGHRHDVQV